MPLMPAAAEGFPKIAPANPPVPPEDDRVHAPKPVPPFDPEVHPLP
jgi:hypothetical protein